MNTEFYIAPDGQLKVYGHPTPNTDEAEEAGIAGFFSSHFCPACGHVSEIPAKFSEKAQTYLDLYGSLLLRTRTINDITAVDPVCEACGGKILTYTQLSRKIKEYSRVFEEAKSFVALAIAVLGFRNAHKASLETGPGVDPASAVETVKALVWEGMNPRISLLSEVMSWNISNILQYVYFLDKAACLDILKRLLDNIIERPYNVEYIDPIASIVALDPTLIPVDYKERLMSWLANTISHFNIIPYHGYRSLQHRQALFTSLATFLYPCDKALVEKRIAEFTSYHSVDKEVDEINAKLCALKEKLKEIDTISPAVLTKRLLETNAFLSPPPDTRDWLTDMPDDDADLRRDTDEVGKISRKYCEGLGSIRDEDSANAVMGLLKRLDSMRDTKQYLGCPRCKKGTLVLASSWMS